VFGLRGWGGKTHPLQYFSSLWDFFNLSFKHIVYCYKK
jgi:hypothetical protein